MAKKLNLGRATELKIISMLLNEDREVYLPVVDDHGVDVLVASKNHNNYQELQIKSLSIGGLFTAITCNNPRQNYWFLFYVKQHDSMWLINSCTFVTIASQNSKGKNKGKYSIPLATTKRIGKKFTQYIITDFSKLP